MQMINLIITLVLSTIHNLASQITYLIIIITYTQWLQCLIVEITIIIMLFKITLTSQILKAISTTAYLLISIRWIKIIALIERTAILDHDWTQKSIWVTKKIYNSKERHLRALVKEVGHWVLLDMAEVIVIKQNIK